MMSLMKPGVKISGAPARPDQFPDPHSLFGSGRTGIRLAAGMALMGALSRRKRQMHGGKVKECERATTPHTFGWLDARSCHISHVMTGRAMKYTP
jgi:hypothetical protein